MGELVLFQHNQQAYEAAIRLMAEAGKAAVIHPTGTGKSFIAFQYAKEHPQEAILWLAPSGYIFSTQKENLAKAGGDVEAICKNIRFLTYAWLMNHEEIMGELRPDVIILDEFHRCGASEWGRSVRRLLMEYPNAKKLGFSATNIRYLDHQRDMAQELFNGCIASEITLGGAIARGILPTPTYVISMYAWQEEFKKLSRRVEGAKNERKRKENEALLEELRRALEHAEGMDRIFQKHMKKRGGKYIVFCSGKEHMEEMTGKAADWFRLVDPSPHIYAVYYDNPETSREFSQFKADDSGRLCLLFCIDMLNEGVHVEDVDGVILLRPTVSPILYLQQIGRSLQTGNGGQPVIFDIVNNFDSLYSIDSIKKEMEEAFFADSRGETARDGYADSFRIYDEVKSCREIFDRINRNLCTSWESYYLEAKRYFAAHGDLRMKKSYETKSGLSVGLWLQTQRRIRSGKVAGTLSQEQIALLDAIGMEWEEGPERNWNRGCRALEDYRNAHGNADVPARYVTEDGYALGKWVSNLRAKRRRGEYEGSKAAGGRGKPLTKEQLQTLDALGMVWEPREERWMERYRAAEDYYLKTGNLDVPHGYVDVKGFSLGCWVDNQRRNSPAESARGEMLNRIGLRWDKRADAAKV